MKVVNICTSDWANFGYQNAKALRSIDIDAVSYCRKAHPFNYEESSEVVTEFFMQKEVQAADVVQIMHTDKRMLEIIKPYIHTNRKFYVYHTGTTYRQDPKYFNDLFNPVVTRSFTDHCELLELGAKDCHYITSPVDIHRLEQFDGRCRYKNKKQIIGHFPSNPEKKGTEKIRQLLDPFKNRYEIRIDETILPHRENLKRIAECDIYFELFAPKQNDKPYGHWGVTAFEAAAMGVKVITQNYEWRHYAKIYGSVPFFLVHNDESVAHLLNSMWELKPDMSQHSYQNTGKRILSLIQ